MTTKAKTTTKTLPQTFIKAFKTVVLREPYPIGKLIEKVQELKQEYFNINDIINIVGYLENDNNILFIDISKKALLSPHVYTKALNESKLLTDKYITSKDKIYFLFYRTAKNYTIFYSSRDNDNIKINYKIGGELDIFKDVFKDANAINTDDQARSIMVNIIQNLYQQANMTADSRMQFIILTYLLLSNDNIIIYTDKEGTNYSLRKYCADFVKAYKLGPGGKWNNNPTRAEYEEVKRFENLTSTFTNKTLIDGFNKIIEYKIKNKSVGGSGYNNIISKQIDHFSSLLKSLMSDKTVKCAKNNMLMIYCQLFEFYGRKLDLCKMVFDAESRYSNRTIGADIAKKGQIYTHTMMKQLIIKIFSKNIKDGMSCYDPTCGTGGFTHDFYKYCEDNNIKDIIAYGNEIDADLSNMTWLSGLCSTQDVRIFNMDCFDGDIKNELIGANTIDFLLMNPPYGMAKKKNMGKHIEPKNFDWHENLDYLRSIKRNANNDIIESNFKYTEMTFCRYNMESFCDYGGWFAWVIPVSCVSENKQNTADKQAIIDKAEIWFVIKMREDIFTPQAGKACCIVIGRYLGSYRTDKEIKTWKTKCIDFTNDGGVIRTKKGEYQYDLADKDANIYKLWNEIILDSKCLDGINEEVGGIKNTLNSILNIEGQKEASEMQHDKRAYYVERNLKANDNWIYTKREQQDDGDYINIFRDFIENRRHAFMTSINKMLSLKEVKKPENINCEWRDTKITDLFDILGKSSKNKYNVNECSPIPTNDKRIKYYSMIDHDNGLKGYVEKPSIEGNDYYIIIGNYGSSNDKYCSYCIQAPFNYDSVHTIIIKPKDTKQFTEDDLTKIAFLIGMKFVKSYTYGNALNSNRLANESVRLPYNKLTNAIDLKITTQFDLTNIECCRDIAISELFELLDLQTYEVNNIVDGDVPLIGHTQHNNGVIGYVNEYSYKSKHPIITVAVSSNPFTFNEPCNGICFVQSGKLAIKDNIAVLRLRKQYSYLEDVLHCFAYQMNEQFKHTYWFRKPLTLSKLMMETLHELPFCQTEDLTKFIIDKNGIQYIYTATTKGTTDKSKMYPVVVYNIMGSLREEPITKSRMNDKIVNSYVEMKEIKISELFEEVPIKHKENINKCENGPYPLIGQSSFNNGIVKYIDHYEFDTTEPLLSLSHDNGGFGYVQIGKFAITEKMHLLTLKANYKYLSNALGLLAFIMTTKFTKIYNYSTKLNKERLFKETISLPVVMTKDGYQINENLLNYYTYMAMM